MYRRALTILKQLLRKDVMAIMTSGKWDLESIITQEFPLEQISEAIQNATEPEKAFNVTI